MKGLAFCLIIGGCLLIGNSAVSIGLAGMMIAFGGMLVLVST